MIRGSTPTFTCSLPADASLFVEIEVIFVQDGKEMIRLTKKDLTAAEGRGITFSLGEEQTLAFAAGVTAELQLRLVTSEGEIFLSLPKRLAVRRRISEDA